MIKAVELLMDEYDPGAAEQSKSCLGYTNVVGIKVNQRMKVIENYI